MVGCSLGWERSDGEEGEEEREIEKENVGRLVYIGFYRWNHRRTVFIGQIVGDFAGERATSLYGDPGLNPSVKSSEKKPRHHTIATFQKNYIIRR